MLACADLIEHFITRQQFCGIYLFNLVAADRLLSNFSKGINGVAYYSSTIFSTSGLTDFQALWASFGFGASEYDQESNYPFTK